MDSYANSTTKYIDKSIKNIVDVILNIDGNAKKPTFEELFKKIVTDNRDPSESILKFQRHIWERLGKPDVDQFGEQVIKDFSYECLAIMMVKFKFLHLK